MQRTIRIQLQPEEETIEVLTQTIEQYIAILDSLWE
ncbi:MAG: hypothetical protein CLLPBCKN_007123 [Chroococcidiopsis cubana SAG 39.79]|nr:hypothetical protein [Chroococcidiopsis cubana SAG 39.79]